MRKGIEDPFFVCYIPWVSNSLIGQTLPDASPETPEIAASWSAVGLGK